MNLTRPESFPFDWIQPGEFLYCRKCGMRLTPEGVTLCEYCKNPLNDTKSVFDADKNVIGYEIIENKAKKECDSKHQELLLARDTLAEKRRSEGLKPLFWMENKNGKS